MRAQRTTRCRDRGRSGRAPWLALGAAAMVLLPPSASESHPHVWIDAVATFVFEERALIGLRHHWAFDEFFGSFVIEEHDHDGDGTFDPDELASLRAGAFDNLRNAGYFTHVRVDGEKVPLERVEDFAARIEDGVLIYDFLLPLPAPVDVASSDFEAGVYDVEYYVEVLLDENDPVRFEGMPSGMCIFEIRADADNPIYYGMVHPPVITLNCATS